MLDLELMQNACQSLTIYRNILADPIVKAYLDHLALLTEPPGEKHPAHTYSYYYHLLVQKPNPLTGADAMQNHLLDLILDDVNPFSHTAASPGGGHQTLFPAVARDLAILHLLFTIRADLILEATTKAMTRYASLPANLAPLPLAVAPRAPEQDETAPYLTERWELKKDMAARSHWDGMAETLADYHARWGCGLYGHHIAFQWQEGELRGVDQPDPITLDQLIGYEETRARIFHNTLQFLHGFPANNMLFYGDRGTGKSSTVKALLNRFWSQGLRLVEVPREQLVDFPAITQQLRHRRHRFILFVDDLSFEENETGYKNLKSIIEGGLAARPDNVLIYATSNRRHLIRETFADRSSGPAEVHGMDSVQEKLSLSDRFGITVIFPTPDQELFLHIVAGLAKQRQLPLPADQLRQRALQWASWNNGRSPRSARQFIDQLEGELALEGLKH